MHPSLILSSTKNPPIDVPFNSNSKSNSLKYFDELTTSILSTALHFGKNTITFRFAKLNAFNHSDTLKYKLTEAMKTLLENSNEEYNKIFLKIRQDLVTRWKSLYTMLKSTFFCKALIANKIFERITK